MSENKPGLLLDDSQIKEVTIEKLIRLGGLQEDIDPERRERVRRHVQQVWAAQQHSTTLLHEKKKRWGMALVASLCIAFMMFGIIHSIFSPSGQGYVQPLAWIDNTDGEVMYGDRFLHPQEAIYADLPLETLGSSVLSLRLSNGALLRVDRSTNIRFLDKHRLQLVSGAIYYDSRESGSISIHTPLGIVSDIGTRFETRLLHDEVVIRVRDGSVRVEQDENVFLVNTGHALQLSENATDYSIIDPNDEYWIWADAMDKKFSFDKRSMAEVLHWLARKQGWELVYQAESDRERARKEILHGEIPFQDADELLQYLSIISDMRHQLSSNVFTVSYPEQDE